MKEAVKVIGGMSIVFVFLMCIYAIWFGASPTFKKVFLTDFVIGCLCFLIDKSTNRKP